MTHYEVLGVAPDVEPQELVRVYRRLCMQYHPDRVPEHLADLKKDAAEKFKAITHAYAVLNNPRKRAQYDAQLRHQKGASQEHADERRRAREQARKQAEEEAFWRGVERMHRDNAEAHRQQLLRRLWWKTRLLIAAGILACLAALSPLLIAGARWAEMRGHQLWWRSASLAANTGAWRVENLRFYPVTAGEKKSAPDAAVTFRGTVKGLDGCYVVPARGSVVAEARGQATIRVELRRLGDWNKGTSYMGTCTENFAPIEAFLEGDIRAWERIELVAVDVDAGVERRFPAPEVTWLAER